MKKMQWITMVLGILLLQSCTKYETGSGPVVSEDRQVNTFAAVKVHADADVEIVEGAVQQVRITGYGNLVNIYKSVVSSSGELELGYKDNYNIRNNNIKVRIVVQDIRAVSLNGSGKISVAGFVNGLELATTINGSGRIDVLTSHFNKLSGTINGSGDLRAITTTTDEVDATINGSGFMEVHCSQKLKVRIQGSGTVDYYGNPVATDVSINGSGSVRKK